MFRLSCVNLFMSNVYKVKGLEVQIEEWGKTGSVPGHSTSSTSASPPPAASSSTITAPWYWCTSLGRGKRRWGVAIIGAAENRTREEGEVATEDLLAKRLKPAVAAAAATTPAANGRANVTGGKPITFYAFITQILVHIQ